MPPGQDRFRLAPVLLLALLAPLSRLGLRHGICDDAYIVLAVVRNLLSGAGAHLDPGSGDAVLSTFLWPAALALPMAAGVPPAFALALLGGAAQAALGVAMFALARALSGSATAGAVVAALLVTHPVVLLPSLGGMETSFTLALVATAAWALARGGWGALALAAGLLPWVRVDGALAALVLLIAGRLAGRRAAQRAIGWGGALGIGAFVAHRLQFGRWLPDSITAKVATESASWSAGAGEVALEFTRSIAGMSAYWLVRPTVHLLLLPLALAGAVRLVRGRGRGAAPAALLTWGAAYVALFVCAGRGYATNFPWYFAPPLVALAALAAIGLAPLAERAERALGRRAAALSGTVPAAAVVLCALAAGLSLVPAFERVGASFTSHRERAYAAAALWLGAHGPAASVASNEIGALAWFSPPGTRIVDLFGISRPAGEPRRPALELVRERRPAAIVTRLDFRYRRELEAELPGAYVWVRFGSLDLGLEPGLALRLAPRAGELEAIYRRVEVESGGRLAASSAISRQSP